MTQTPLYFRPRNWSKFQSRSNNSMAWVKNFTALLMDPEYAVLTYPQRGVLHGIWLLSGVRSKPLPYCSKFIGRALQRSSPHVADALRVLLSNDFIELCGSTQNAHEKLPTTREEEKRVDTDTSLRSVSSAAALNGTPVDDMSQAIWGGGLKWLIENTGKREDQLRPLLGKWVKSLGEGETFERMREMFRAAPADPISWMERICNERSGKKPSSTATAVAGILGKRS